MSDQTDDDGVPLDTEVLQDWLQHRTKVTGPLRATQIAGGRSNLTYRIEDAAGRAFVLRRPPLGTLLPGAHDMSREHRIMAALADTPVPVPQVVGLCTDEAVLGADFYVMRFTEGTVIRTKADAQSLPVALRGAASRDLAKTLAALHAIDPERVGLGDRSRGQDYIARQLHVWKRQMDGQKGRELPLMDQVHQRLSATVPPQQGVAIVHGDYRLDNVMLASDGTVAAVLDWELWTLGDPLADLAITMTYWTDSADAAGAVIGRPTTVPGFGDRHVFRHVYGQAGGPQMPDDLLPYYLSFGIWRLAAILEGVYQRNRAGAYGDSGDDWKSFEHHVPAMAQQAAAYADQADI